jgi:hypothetical protein
VAGDGGVIEEIRLGSINEHDLGLSREMMPGSGILKTGDILINDRGFLPGGLAHPQGARAPLLRVIFHAPGFKPPPLSGQLLA